MSIFGSILGAIFGGGASASTAPQPHPNPPQQHPAPPKPGQPAPGQQAHPAANPQPAAKPTAPQQAAPAQLVDVEAKLDKMVADKGQKLDWRHSIVDLMKLMDIDSSLGARKELAKELHYSGDTNDSAAMNIWLHKEVMSKLQQNGGKVPDALVHHTA